MTAESKMEVPSKENHVTRQKRSVLALESHSLETHGLPLPSLVGRGPILS